MRPFRRALLALLLPTWAAAAPCPPADLERAVTRAEDAYARMEPQAFDDAVDEGLLVLDCLGTAIDPPTAARLHRLVGLRAFADGQPDRVKASLAAARQVAPDLPLPPEWIPDGHPLSQAWQAAPATPSAPEAVPEPVTGALAFDGRRGPSRPADRATIAQVLGPDDVPTETAYLYPGDPLPDYEALALPTGPSRSATAPLWIASGTAAAGALALFGAAAISEARFKDPAHAPDATRSDLEDMQRRTNTLFYTSVGLGAAALAGGGAAVVTGRF